MTSFPADLRGAPPKLLGRLGRGRLGETWRAEEPTGEAVAAKVVPLDRVPDPAAAVRAVRALAAIRDPQLLAIRRAFLAEGQLWLLQALDGGVPVRRALSVVAPTPGQVVAIGHDILCGLAAL